MVVRSTSHGAVVMAAPRPSPTDGGTCRNVGTAPDNSGRLQPARPPHHPNGPATSDRATRPGLGWAIGDAAQGQGTPVAFSCGLPFRRCPGTLERYQGTVETEPREDAASHHKRGAPEHFARLCAAVTARLPFGLPRVVPPTLVGFAAINGFTFCADLLILTALHSHWGAPYAVAVGVGYAAAFALSFLLNRVLNFRSHDPVGRQTLVSVGVVALTSRSWSAAAPARGGRGAVPGRTGRGGRMRGPLHVLRDALGRVPRNRRRHSSWRSNARRGVARWTTPISALAKLGAQIAEAGLGEDPDRVPVVIGAPDHRELGGDRSGTGR
jgi:GtrA-like protein